MKQFGPRSGSTKHPGMGPNCLQRLSAEKKVAASEEKVTEFIVWMKSSVDPDQHASSKAS